MQTKLSNCQRWHFLYYCVILPIMGNIKYFLLEFYLVSFMHYCFNCCSFNFYDSLPFSGIKMISRNAYIIYLMYNSRRCYLIVWVEFVINITILYCAHFSLFIQLNCISSVCSCHWDRVVPDYPGRKHDAKCIIFHWP